MAVKLRLRRRGKRNAPSHRLVATEGSKPRDGRFIETLGIYDPRRDIEDVNVERVNYWLAQGAQPSSTVSRLIKRAQARAQQEEASPATEQKETSSDNTQAASE